LWGLTAAKKLLSVEFSPWSKVNNAGISTVTCIFFRENQIRDTGHTSAFADAWGVKKRKKKTTTENKELLIHRLTTGNLQRHWHFLHNRPQSWKRCKATVITSTVIFLHVCKVEISLKAHGDPFILRNVLQI